MSASPLNPENWWFPKKGAGLWKVQVTPERPDFGLCVNAASGERKSWLELKRELYGDDWLELVREAVDNS